MAAVCPRVTTEAGADPVVVGPELSMTEEGFIAGFTVANGAMFTDDNVVMTLINPQVNPVGVTQDDGRVREILSENIAELMTA